MVVKKLDTKVTGSGPMASNRKETKIHHGLLRPQKKKPGKDVKGNDLGLF
jgi:hypothetical protein